MDMEPLYRVERDSVGYDFADGRPAILLHTPRACRTAQAASLKIQAASVVLAVGDRNPAFTRASPNAAPT